MPGKVHEQRSLVGSRELDMTEYMGHTPSVRGGLAEQRREESLPKWPGLNGLFIQDRSELDSYHTCKQISIPVELYI